MMGPEFGRGGVLDAAAIRDLIGSERPLVRGLRDPDRQLQPNGIDLTLDSVWDFDGAGTLGAEDTARVLAPRRELGPAADGWHELAPGPYLVRVNEVVDLPDDLMAFGRSRSSLLRCGVAIHNAVWDAGYTGRSEALLVVYNPRGFRVQRHARILQLVFCRLERPTVPYRGRFQGENVVAGSADPGSVG